MNTTYTLNDPPVFYQCEGGNRSIDCQGCVGCIYKDRFQRHEETEGGLGLCQRLKNISPTPMGAAELAEEALNG
jgi:hypothetical protein